MSNPLPDEEQKPNALRRREEALTVNEEPRAEEADLDGADSRTSAIRAEAALRAEAAARAEAALIQWLWG